MHDCHPPTCLPPATLDGQVAAVPSAREFPVTRARLLSAAAALLLLAGCADRTADGAATGTGGAGAARPGSQEDLVATGGGDRVFFDFDSSTLSPEAQAILDRQAEWFGRNPSVAAQLEGHADERGTREYNLGLGQRRANAARDYLVARGVAGGRLSTISFGKDRPDALGSNEQAWAQNRRAVTAVR